MKFGIAAVRLATVADGYGATMASAQVPKYQMIYAKLREQILAGQLKPGERLPPQQDMAADFTVTLMTLRQAVAALEVDGLVRVDRGLGTFVADRPVDIRFDNLSSFAEQMRSAGADLATEVVSVEALSASAVVASRLGIEIASPVVVLTRLRRIDGLAFALQRSSFVAGVLSTDAVAALGQGSLYDLFEAGAGLRLAEARESIRAIMLTSIDAELLHVAEGDVALESTRTSLSDTGQPFLFDRAVLVGSRAEISANRTSDRLALRYGASLLED